MLTKLSVFIMVILFETTKGDDAFVPTIPKECLKQGYCEHVPSYPEDLAEELVIAMGDKTYTYFFDDLDSAVPTRRDPDELLLCEASRRAIILKAAQDREGKWHFVLNPKNNTVIMFHVELCKNEEGPCNAVAIFPVGYKATCKQNFIEQSVIVIGEQGALERRPLMVPSDCYCKVIPRYSINQ